MLIAMKKAFEFLLILQYPWVNAGLLFEPIFSKFLNLSLEKMGG
jgi:hypothetical protein